MGQLGFQEIMVIFVIALLVFGPKKLPELGKSLGKGLREFRKATNDLKASWEDQVRDVDSDVKETRRDFSKIGQDIRNTIRDDSAKSSKSGKSEASPNDSTPAGHDTPPDSVATETTTQADVEKPTEPGPTPAAPETPPTTSTAPSTKPDSPSASNSTGTPAEKTS